MKVAQNIPIKEDFIKRARIKSFKENIGPKFLGPMFSTKTRGRRRGLVGELACFLLFL